MRNLIYSLITEKEVKRHIKIIEMLNANRKYLEYDEMQDVLGVTKKTVKSDVAHLAKGFPESMKITSTKQYISLSVSNNEDIQDFIFSLVKETFSYRILNYAYKGPVISLEELAKHLFTSQTTLKKRISQINMELLKFRCKLSTYNSSIIGAESNIRYFYYAYYTELQEIFNISKYQGALEHQNIFNALREELIRRQHKRLNFSHFQLRQWLRVCVDRISANYTVSLDPALMDKIKTDPQYQDYKTVFTTVLRKYFSLISIIEDETVWAYIACLDAVIYSKHFSDLKMRRNDPLAKAFNKKVLILVLEFAGSLEIEATELDDFFEVHCAFFENMFLLSNISPVFQMASSRIRFYAKQNLKHLYHMWHTHLTQSIKHIDGSFTHLEDLCSKLTMLTSQFIYNKKIRIKTVLFSFTGESGIPNYLETMVRNVFPQEINCVFIFNELLSASLIHRVNPEIVVCNYNNVEEISFSNVVRVPYLPSINDWATLMERIFHGNIYKNML